MRWSSYGSSVPFAHHRQWSLWKRWHVLQHFLDHVLRPLHCVLFASYVHYTGVLALVNVHLGPALLLDFVDLPAPGADEPAGAARVDLDGGLCLAHADTIAALQDLHHETFCGGDVLRRSREAHQALFAGPVNVDLGAATLLQLLDPGSTSADEPTHSGAGDLHELAFVGWRLDDLGDHLPRRIHLRLHAHKPNAADGSRLVNVHLRSTRGPDLCDLLPPRADDLAGHAHGQL
mmetsp:Transcript_136090/g.379320  ORF Transcript_136090/g.379320 Transcript_136090/m.379320 type:complete len:233 (+) Transcript_136090:475-1173(+)